MACKYKLIQDILNLEGYYISTRSGRRKLKYVADRRELEIRLRLGIRQDGIRGILDHQIFEIRPVGSYQYYTVYGILQQQLLLNKDVEWKIRDKINIDIPPYIPSIYATAPRFSWGQ